MFEIEAVDSAARDQLFHEHPEWIVRSAPGGWSRAARVAPLAWSEHCVECAIPQCYTSCDLYRPRLDGKCRRFTYGIAPNHTVRAWLPYSVEVDFRIISTLWSQGNARTIPLSLYNLLDASNRVLGRVSTLAARLFKGLSPKRRVVRGFYHLRKSLIATLQSAGGQKADGFLLQAINPHQDTLRAQLVIVPDPRPSG